MITVTAFVGADQVRQQVGAAPAGDQAEEDLGQGERRRAVHRRCGSRSAARPRGRRRWRAPLTKRERRHAAARRACAKTAWPSSGDRRAPASRSPACDDGEVGAGGEDERLAGDADARDLVVGQARASIAALSAISERGPKVLGLVWSKPLSRVIRPSTPAPPGSVDVAQVGLGDDARRRRRSPGRGVSRCGQVAHQASSPCRSAGSPR